MQHWIVTVRCLESQNPEELAPKSLKLSWKSILREKRESVDAACNIPVTPFQNGHLCITKYYIFNPVGAPQSNTVSQGLRSFADPTKRPGVRELWILRCFLVVQEENPLHFFG